jgi:hypothetical protein
MKRHEKLICCAVAGAVLLPSAVLADEETEALKADIEALRQEVRQASEWKGILSHAHLAGYGAVNYVSTREEGVNDSFSLVRFNPIFHYEFHDKVMLESELEIEITNEGETETDLEYAAIDVFLNDYATLVAGKVLSPLGQFRQNLHPLWINKLPSEPVGFGHDGAAPAAEIGLELRGGWPMGNARGNYAIYVGNGPELEAEGSEIEGIMTGGFTEDKDGKKVVGGRIGILPIPQLEIGVSAASGKAIVTVWDVGPIAATEPNRDYDVIGADAAWSVAGIRALAEYIQQKVGDAPVSLAPVGGKWESWYAQLSYLIPQSNWEAVMRYGDFDSPHASMDQKQTAVGVNYLFAPQAIGKLAWESNDGVDNTTADADRFLAQLAYGF